MHDAAVEPAEQIDALLAVRFPRIFPTDDRVFEDRLATREIEIAVFDIAQALCFISSRHVLIVATIKRVVLRVFVKLVDEDVKGCSQLATMMRDQSSGGNTVGAM